LSLRRLSKSGDVVAAQDMGAAGSPAVCSGDGGKGWPGDRSWILDLVPGRETGMTAYVVPGSRNPRSACCSWWKPWREEGADGALSPLGPAGCPWWDGLLERTWCGGACNTVRCGPEVPANAWPMTPINHHGMLVEPRRISATGNGGEGSLPPALREGNHSPLAGQPCVGRGSQGIAG